jgi:hypothetical protein
MNHHSNNNNGTANTMEEQTKPSHQHQQQNHQQRLLNVALLADAAAKVGTLTRLSEEVVESVAGVAGVKEDDDHHWNVRKGLDQKDLLLSPQVQVIHEAAAMGRMRRLPPHVVTNYKEDEQDEEQVIEEQKKPSNNNNNINNINSREIIQIRGDIRKASALIDTYVQGQKEQKIKSWMDENYVLERFEEQQQDFSLPSLVPPPSFVQTNKQNGKITVSPSSSSSQSQLQSPQAMNRIVAKSAADGACARTIRLIGDQQLKVTTKCIYAYCVNPSPMQTKTYQDIMNKQQTTSTRALTIRIRIILKFKKVQIIWCL